MVMRTHGKRAALILALRQLLPSPLRRRIKVTNVVVNFDATSYIKVSI